MPRRAEGFQLADASVCVAYIERVFGQRVAEGTLRAWVSEGLLTRKGYRGRRAMYDLREVHTLMESRFPEPA